MTIVQTWPLEHWAAHTSGKVHLKQGPHATLVDEGELAALLAKAQTNVTGIAKRGGVKLDESQLLDLQRTYFADEHRTVEPDSARVAGFDAEWADEVEVGPFTDEHGFDRTPGQWTYGGAL